MQSKFGSMFLGNIVYSSKNIFKVKKRDTRLLHPRKFLDELHNIYFKIHSTFTSFLIHSRFTVVHFKLRKYFSLMVRQHQNVVLTTLYNLINFRSEFNCIVGVACVFY